MAIAGDLLEDQAVVYKVRSNPTPCKGPFAGPEDMRENGDSMVHDGMYYDIMVYAILHNLIIYTWHIQHYQHITVLWYELIWKGGI